MNLRRVERNNARITTGLGFRSLAVYFIRIAMPHLPNVLNSCIAIIACLLDKQARTLDKQARKVDKQARKLDKQARKPRGYC
jgi:uncharacterized membrane protein